MKKLLFLVLFLIFVISLCAFQAQESGEKNIYGVASWYGPRFHGRTMANGRIYNMHKISFASRDLPLGTTIVVTNLENGLVVAGKVTDRGPYIDGRILDVSLGAAKRLGMVYDGLAQVEIKVRGS